MPTKTSRKFLKNSCATGLILKTSSSVAYNRFICFINGLIAPPRVLRDVYRSGFEVIGMHLPSVSSLLAVVGCAPHVQAPQLPQKPPTTVDMPIFTFDPIEVQPASPVAGQAFNVSMKVANTGPAAGTYKADLIINGNNADNRALYLDRGQS